MLRRTIPASCLISVLLLFGAHSSSTFAGADDLVIAEVGPQTITAREVLDATQRIFIGEPSDDPLADRRRLLEPIIQAKLLVAEAEALGLETPNIRRNLHKTECDYLVHEFENADIKEMIVVPENELQEAVELQKRHLFIRHIMSHTQADADSVLAELQAGAEFQELARQRSVESRSAAQGGLLPPLTWGAADVGFIRLASSLEPGQIGGPLQTQQGWHVVRLDSIVERDVDEDTLREEAEESLRRGLFNQRQTEYLQEMTQKLHFTVSDSMVTFFIDHMRRWNEAGGLDLSEAEGSVDRFGFTAEEEVMEVFTYDGGAFTIGDYALYMGASPLTQLQQRVGIDRVHRDLIQYFRHWAYADLARERGYAEMLGLDHTMRRQRERALVQEFQQRYITLSTLPSAELLRRQHDAHPERYVSPASVLVTEIAIIVPRRATVLMRALEQNAGIEEALATTELEGESPAARVQHGVMIYQGRENYDQALAVGAGQVVNAGLGADGFQHFLIVESARSGRALGFDEARVMLVRDVSARLEEERYNEKIAELKEKYTIVIHEEALMQLPL